MNQSATGPHFLVLDDFLDEESWTRIWTDFQFLELNPVTRTTGAWKLEDGVPLGGQEVILPRPSGAKRAPSPTGAQSSLTKLLARITQEEDALAALLDGNWDRVVGRPWVYPRGTGLSWHVDDSEVYAGAFIYYAHPAWNAHWGGELLIGELGEGEPLPVMGYRFETESYSERLLSVGGGAFVMPKPNRLVLIAGAPHMVARVTDAAGHNVRASIAGFFLRPARPAEKPAAKQSAAPKSRAKPAPSETGTKRKGK